LLRYQQVWSDSSTFHTRTHHIGTSHTDAINNWTDNCCTYVHDACAHNDFGPNTRAYAIPPNLCPKYTRTIYCNTTLVNAVDHTSTRPSPIGDVPTMLYFVL
jgi:hypothetical protein